MHRLLLDALTKVARPLILEVFNRDSCIASTRIAIDALASFGVVAEPMSLSVTVYNRAAAEAITQGPAVANLMNFRSALRANEGDEIWSVAIGAGLSEPDPVNPTWSGHLVAVIPEYVALIDLAIDQASRPTKGLTLEAFWLQVPHEQWWTGTEPSTEFLDSAGNVLVLDRRCPDPTGYLTSPNWDVPEQYEADFRELTARVVSAMRSELGLGRDTEHGGVVPATA
jgi:hypothetical protein